MPIQEAGKDQADVLNGTWYVADAGEIVRLEFEGDTLTISGYDLTADAEEYIPFVRMHVTKLSDDLLKMDVTAVKGVSEESEGFMDREMVIEMLIKETFWGSDNAREYAEEYADDMFYSVMLNYFLKEDGILALAEEGEEFDNYLPEPPTVHPALRGSR